MTLRYLYQEKERRAEELGKTVLLPDYNERGVERRKENKK
jgi:hypothetical protein